jgi:DNA mismatch repair protein PMS2
MVRREAAMAACHMSVRVGDVLRMEEMRELVEGLGGLDSPWNCPHGRPTIVKLVDVRDSMERISFERVY